MSDTYEAQTPLILVNRAGTLARYRAETVPGDPHAATSKVYFLYAVGMIKIGTARNPVRRMLEIQVGMPFKAQIVCLIPGGRLTEEYMHHIFREHHHRGEWFRLGDSLRATIKAISPPEVSVWVDEEEEDHRAWIKTEAERFGLI